MEFNELKKEVKAIEFEALRTDCDNYFEAVIVKRELGLLTERLNKLFGEPAWPSKNRLSLQIEETLKNFGGIMPGQTLYFRGQGSESIFVMLWPWQDGLRTTLKIIQK